MIEATRNNKILSENSSRIICLSVYKKTQKRFQSFTFQVMSKITGFFFLISGLMIPDILHIVIPLWELYNFAKRKELKINELCYKEEIFISILFVSFGTLIGQLLQFFFLFFLLCIVYYLNDCITHWAEHQSSKLKVLGTSPGWDIEVLFLFGNLFFFSSEVSSQLQRMSQYLLQDPKTWSELTANVY